MIEIAGQINIDREQLKKELYIIKNDQKNPGSNVIQDLKWHIKISRQNSIHFSPTVVFNGLVEDVSSSWDFQKWVCYLESKDI